VRDIDVLQSIGPEVMDQSAADAEKLAVRVYRDIERPVLVALLGGVREVLAPVLDPFDWALEELGCRHHRDVLGIDAELGTEAAADIGSCYTQAAFVEIEQRGQRLEQVVRFLRRGPHGQCVVAPFRENAAPFDRMGTAAMLPELLVKNMGGLGEGRIRIAIGYFVGGGDIGIELTSYRGRTRLDRAPRVSRRRKHV